MTLYSHGSFSIHERHSTAILFTNGDVGSTTRVDGIGIHSSFSIHQQQHSIWLSTSIENTAMPKHLLKSVLLTSEKVSNKKLCSLDEATTAKRQQSTDEKSSRNAQDKANNMSRHSENNNDDGCDEEEELYEEIVLFLRKSR